MDHVNQSGAWESSPAYSSEVPPGNHQHNDGSMVIDEVSRALKKPLQSFAVIPKASNQRSNTNFKSMYCLDAYLEYLVS